MENKTVDFHELNEDNFKTAVVVFTAGSFKKEYTEAQRSYEFTNENRKFQSGAISSSLFGNCLDGTDAGVRLDHYIYDGGWKIEKTYITEM